VEFLQRSKSFCPVTVQGDLCDVAHLLTYQKGGKTRGVGGRTQREDLADAGDEADHYAGWVVRDVVGGTAVLEGPDGVWKTTRGDTVPGVGRVDFIVRWGSRHDPTSSSM